MARCPGRNFQRLVCIALPAPGVHRRTIVVAGGGPAGRLRAGESVVGGEHSSGMSHLHPHRSDDDQVFQKYLDRAIADVNTLADRIARCDLCSHEPDWSAVIGTGHPLADIFMVKYSPTSSELSQGVAFYGRAGDAILRSVQRLNIDPLDIYGTNCIKCSGQPDECARRHCPSWLLEELRIVGPKLLVVMGHEALEAINGLDHPDAATLVADPGRLQTWTHTCEALWCPDIDASLDGPAPKQAFWRAFRQIGSWYDDRPPW
jgi:uracil-DNA glycosylase family 4